MRYWLPNVCLHHLVTSVVASQLVATFVVHRFFPYHLFLYPQEILERLERAVSFGKVRIEIEKAERFGTRIVVQNLPVLERHTRLQSLVNLYSVRSPNPLFKGIT